jgi:integrase
MAKVRRRTWLTSAGEPRQAWIADYFDQGGKRHQKAFPTRKAADAYLVEARHQVARGVHTADSESPTVAEAAAEWLRRARADGLEPSTLRQYDHRVRLHILPLIGETKLSKLTAPVVEEYRSRLLETRSRTMAQRVLTTFKAIVADAARHGRIAHNPARDARPIRIAARYRKVVEIPTRPELQAMLASATGRLHPFIMTAALTGLRASELRGLEWLAVDFETAVLHVRQRADERGMIGKVKSGAARRSIPLPPMLATTLKAWKLRCPPGAFVFPNGAGKVESHQNIMRRELQPLLDKLGLKHYGLHAFRHFCASWWIDQGLGIKRVSALLGHSSISLTADTYGHLFPAEDDAERFAAAERALLLA